MNRLLIIASLQKQNIHILNPAYNQDILTMLACLSSFALKSEKTERSLYLKPFTPNSFNHELYVHDSATALRFVLSRMACEPGHYFQLDVSSQLSKRPIQELIQNLRQLGAIIPRIEFPLEIGGVKLKGGEIELDASISSQYLSSLLLIAPRINTALTLNLTGKTVSVSYLEMTRKLMQQCGIKTEYSGCKLFIQEGQEYHLPDTFEIEPDLSSACYFWALSALTGKEIPVWYPHRESLQADHDFLNVLQEMGCKVIQANETISVQGNQLRSVDIDMNSMPDQVPTLAMLGLFADNPVKIRNVSQLKYKESNRLDALLTQLPKLGAKVVYENDILTVYPLNKEIPNCLLNTYNDHRLAMTYSLLKTVHPQIEIDDLKSVGKSYPAFLQDLDEVLNDDEG